MTYLSIVGDDNTNYMLLYPLKLISCRKGSWSHVGSSPTWSTKLIRNYNEIQ